MAQGSLWPQPPRSWYPSTLPVAYHANPSRCTADQSRTEPALMAYRLDWRLHYPAQVLQCFFFDTLADVLQLQPWCRDMKLRKCNCVAAIWDNSKHM